MLERQFRRYFGVAQHQRGLTGLNMLQILECRFDNVVFRMGLADSRPQARQIVNHGHFTVNGINSDIPSQILKPGDTIAVREGSRNETFFKQMPEMAEQRTCAVWLDRDLKGLSGRVVRIPERPEIDGNLNEQLIVEFYSR
jgi:small subunit ribosomal protein S4